VRDVESTPFRPEKELKGFAKIELQPGGETEVAIDLDRRAFAYYDAALRDQVNSIQQGVEPAAGKASAAYHDFPKGTPVDQGDFEALLGRHVPPNQGSTKGEYTINTPIGDMNDSFIARQLYSVMRRQIAKMIAGQEGTPTALLMEAMVREMPMRSLLMMGDGPFTRETLDALLLMINGKILRGLTSFIGAFGQKGK
jgi:beta-glucosidase